MVAKISRCAVCPVHAAESYLLTLIRKGFRVAVCEQMEDPAEAKKRGGSKAVVRREVVRLVTPGTLTEDTLLDARTHNYLAAWADVRGEGALAWADISTGDLNVMPCPRFGWVRNCSACRSARCWFRPTWTSRGRTPLAEAGPSVTPLGRAVSTRFGGKAALGLFGVASLDAFGIVLPRGAFGAGRAVGLPRDHAEGGLPLLARHGGHTTARLMQIDVATRRNLELTRSLTGAAAGEPSGRARPYGHGGRRAFAGTARVRARDQMPRTIARHDAVAHFVSDMRVRDEIRGPLSASVPTSNARCRGWRWTGAGRGIWPHFGTVWRRPR
jgi:DNA mismatch repair protein MutS